MRFRKIPIMLCFLVAVFGQTSICLGQEASKRLTVFGTLKDEFTITPIIDGKIVVLIESDTVRIVSPNEFGEFEFELNQDKFLKIFFTGPKYQSKFIEIDSRNIPEKIYDFGFDLDMTLSKKDGPSLLDSIPIGKAKYIKKNKTISFDYDYTRAVQSKLDSLKNEVKKEDP